ncbi:MAG: hypothetical protein H0V07_00855 [Propionibacteriales bacterium]|nr:hypothetical protein [Propionibacteriales bacterium]
MGRSPASHRLRAVTAGAVAAALVTGCGAGFQAQSQQIYQPAVGVNDRSGSVYTINTLVVTDGKGDGTIIAALINQARQDDTLHEVSATDGSSKALAVKPLAHGGVALASGQSVQLADSGAVRVSGKSLEAGSLVTVTFTFAQAAPITVDAPVVSNRSSVYSNVPVGR